MLTEVRHAAKAVFAALVAGLAALGGLLVNDTALGEVTAGQWVFVALSALIAGGGVYRISNGQPGLIEGGR